MKKGFLFVLLLYIGVSAVAAEPSEAMVPQFLAGTLGGYAGGALGAFTVSRAFAAGATGWEALSRAILGAVVGFAGGTVVGSSLGVVIVSQLIGVEGSVGRCFLGAAAGTGMVFGIGFILRRPEFVPYAAPPIAAAGATAGFNRGG